MMFKNLLALFALIALPLMGSRAEEPVPAQTKTAIFAGGCFWCIQPPFDQAKGVLKTVVGYTGGDKKDANYEAVSSERTKHREAIEVTYDPTQISYEQLLDIFWRNINPTQADGQFYDIGPSYQAAVFYANEDEKRVAEESKRKLSESGRFQKPIVTEILPAKPFYPAEEYHQKYSEKKPREYNAYHTGSGRDAFFEKHSDQKPKP